MVAKGKPQPELLAAEMCNNLQVKIYYFNTAHSKFEMLLIIFVASTEFLKHLCIHLSGTIHSIVILYTLVSYWNMYLHCSRYYSC